MARLPRPAPGLSVRRGANAPAALLLAAVVACSGRAVAPGAPGPSGMDPSAGEPGQPATAPPGVEAAGRLLRFAEETEEGERIEIEQTARAHVDINSLIHIRPVDGALPIMLDLLPPELREDPAIRRISAVGDTLEGANRLLAGISGELVGLTRTIGESAERLKAAPDDAAAEAVFRQALAAHARILIPTLEYLMARGYDTDSALAGSDPRYAALAPLLRQDVERLEASLAAALDAFRASRAEVAPRVQLWAVHSGPDRPPVQVHLDGYDNLPNADPRPVEKLSFAMTAEERERLERSQRFHQDVVSAVAEVRVAAARVHADADAVAEIVTTELRLAGDVLESLPNAVALDRLRADLTGAAQAGVRAAIDSIIAAVRPLEELRSAHDELVRSFRAQPVAAIPFDLLVDRAGRLRTAVEGLADTARIRTRLDASLETLRSAAAAALSDAGADLAARLRPLIDESIPRWREAGIRLAGIGQRYRLLARRLEDLTTLADFGELSSQLRAARLSPDRIRERLTAVRADQLRPTVLDLTRIDPREGDQIVISVRVSDRAGAATLAQAEQIFAVRTYGFHRRWSGGLAFARTEDRSGFRPGFSTTWILHHRSRPGNHAPWYRDALDPRWVGLGLTSVVFSADDGVQLGFGATATLFSDLLQVGGGLNLQTEERYVLIATPLLDLIQRLTAR